ncbi:MAG: hypothetical protein ACYS3N_24040 [Planctomycetota bacterium]|jgi:hypothetical protein
MMKKEKKPTKIFAILFTVSAVCSLVTLILMIVGQKTSTGLMVFQALTALLLVIGASGNWYQYTQRYIKYEVQKKLSEENKQL